jgi:hypothetical protein
MKNSLVVFAALVLLSTQFTFAQTLFEFPLVPKKQAECVPAHWSSTPAGLQHNFDYELWRGKRAIEPSCDSRFRTSSTEWIACATEGLAEGRARHEEWRRVIDENEKLHKVGRTKCLESAKLAEREEALKVAGVRDQQRNLAQTIVASEATAALNTARTGSSIPGAIAAASTAAAGAKMGDALNQLNTTLNDLPELPRRTSSLAANMGVGVVNDTRSQIESARIEAQRREAQRLDALKIEAQKAEARRVEAEQENNRRVEAQKIEAERLASQRAIASNGSSSQRSTTTVGQQPQLARNTNQTNGLLAIGPTSTLVTPTTGSPGRPPEPMASPNLAGRLPTGTIEFSLPDRYDIRSTTYTTVRVTVAEFEDNERRFKACRDDWIRSSARSKECDPFEYRYRTDGLQNPFVLQDYLGSPPGAKRVQCKHTPHSYTLPNTLQQAPEITCRALLGHAIHEGAETEVEFHRTAGKLFAAADIALLAGASTGRCKEDLAFVESEAAAARKRRPASATNEQFVQTTVYFGIQRAKVLEASCKGQPQAEGMDKLKQSIGSLYNTCKLFKNDISVCKPSLAY